MKSLLRFTSKRRLSVQTSASCSLVDVRHHRSFGAVTRLPNRKTTMAPIAVTNCIAPDTHTKDVVHKQAVTKPVLARCDARDTNTTIELLVSILERDGGVIVENIITQDHAALIRDELKPYFDTDKIDHSGFFPTTTQRATGLLARSDACVRLAMNKTYIDVANKMLSSTYTYWNGQQQETVTSKPIISSTVGFRVNPGGRQQALHRDDR
jgi:hypothetical protein